MEFLYNCYQLHTKLRIHAETIIEQLDKSFPKYGILKQYEKQSPEARNLLRILYYPKTKKPEQFYQAHPHIDRCFLTTHIWDSKPGLILIDKNKVTPYTTSTDQILNFFGVKAQLQTKGHFTPKPHLVKTKDLTERISIVFFTHISGDEKLVTEIVDTISEHLTQTYKQNHPK
jgi:isopenicillin N synthase-like dioxygenase